ncbi:FtsX-like permease family protein [Halobacillus litoralis]|uniref:FtsX-like permease family protein n=1 Tax=Halobacillus litoralis TaxID=45668 RepID=A0A845FD13_9BACI|nr:FtsX-like permease family protein [Halobacillus litoralis]MYL72283.1 FtsX-like permease family protein [Halobacillus litoralis]
MILKKSVYRTLKEKKFQYAGVAVLLLLAVMLYVSLSMAITTLESRNETFTEDYRQESFHFVAGGDVTDEQLSLWEDEYNVVLEKRNYADFEIDDSTLRTFTTTDTVNIPYIAEGKAPSSAQELAISKVFAEKHQYELGDVLTLGDREFEITGFVYLPDYIYMVEQMTDLLADAEKFGVAVISGSDISEVNGQTQILGWTDDGAVPEGFREAVSAETALLQFVHSEDNPRIGFVETEIQGAKSMTTTLPLFILALSIAMVLMLMKRRMEMQRKEIGTLMALGYRKKELVRHYLGYAWIIGLAGTVGGLAAGAGLSVPLSNLYANYFNLPALSMFDWNPFVLVIGFVLPLLLLILLTTFVINRTLRTEPLTLLRPKEMSSGKKSWLEKLPLLQKGGFIRRFRLRLLVRNKARSFYIFIGVMFSTVLLLFGFITFNSMDQLVETTYKDILKYDYAVHYQSLMTEETDEQQSPFTMNELGVVDEDVKITAYGMEKENRYIQLSADGESLESQISEGAIISAPLAAVLGVGEGDDINLENSLNSETMRVEVVAVADLYIGNNLYLPRVELNDFLGFPDEGYTGTWQKQSPQNSGNIYMVEDKQKAIDSFESTTGATRASVAGMAVFAVLIGVIVLTLLTNLIVEENSPSISLFKVMGYHDKEVSKLVLSVYTPIVLIAYFVSIPLASLSLDQTMNTLVQETGFLMPTDVAWWMVLTGFIVIMLTYWLSLGLSKRKLKDVSLQEALKKQQD